jgi:hypothetical protein
MNCRCENPRHLTHAGRPCTAVATETDNYCKPCRDKVAIEVRRDEDSWELSLFIHGSFIENAEVHQDALRKGFLYLYSDFDEVTHVLLPLSFSDFIEARITDIQVPFEVSWNEAIGALVIKYETDEDEAEAEEKSSLEIEFSRVSRWFGRPCAFDEYYRTLHNFVEVSNRIGVENRETETYHEPAAVIFAIDETLPLIVEVERCVNTLRDIHEEVLVQLGADINSLEVAFDFPEEVRVPCEQYLLYFGQFLADVGVKATTNIQHEAGQVLFSVTPEDKDTALETIHIALGEYLNLVRAPIDEASIVSIAEQRLAANVDHLKGQLRLKNAELQLAHATIQTQEVAIQILRGDVLIESVKNVTPQASEEKESFLGNTVALKPFNYKGVEVNYPEIFRKLRRLFNRSQD